MATTHQFMVRLPEPAIARLTEVALEHGFVGGRGRHGQDEPNLSEAARYLLGQADPQLFAIIYDTQEPS
jgi:hypothetical protein